MARRVGSVCVNGFVCAFEWRQFALTLSTSSDCEGYCSTIGPGDSKRMKNVPRNVKCD